MQQKKFLKLKKFKSKSKKIEINPFFIDYI